MDALAPVAISFVVPGVPVPWARAASKGIVRFTLARQRNAAVELKILARAAMGGMPLLEGPLSLNVWASWPKPKRAKAAAAWDLGPFKNCVGWRVGRPDADNLLKQVADSLNGIVYRDDSQIVRMWAAKVYGERAELAVRVEPLR